MGNDQSTSTSNSSVAEQTSSTSKSVKYSRSEQAILASRNVGPPAHETSTRVGGIVTVHAGASVDSNSAVDDTASLLDKAQSVPICYPLLPSAIGLEDKRLFVETRSTVLYFLRLQEYLKQCADAVAFDQASINLRIREVDAQARLLNDTVSARRKRAARAAEQLDKSRELATTFARVQMSLEAAAKLADRLNQMLPPSEQLEPFNITPFTDEVSR